MQVREGTASPRLGFLTGGGQGDTKQPNTCGRESQGTAPGVPGGERRDAPLGRGGTEERSRSGRAATPGVWAPGPAWQEQRWTGRLCAWRQAGPNGATLRPRQATPAHGAPCWRCSRPLCSRGHGPLAPGLAGHRPLGLFQDRALAEPDCSWANGPLRGLEEMGRQDPRPPHPRAPPGGAAPAPAPSRAGPPGTGPGSRSLGHRVEGVLVTEGPRCAPEHGPLTLLGSTPPPVAPTHRPVGSFQNLNRAVSFGSCPCPCASAGTLPAQPAHVGRGPSLPGTRHAGSRVPRVSPPRAPAPRSPASSRLSQLPLRPGRRGHTHAPSVSWSPQAVAPAAPTPPGARDEGGGGGQGAQAAGRGRSGCSTPPRRPAAWPRPFLSRPQFPGAERSEAGTAGVKRAPAPAPPSRPLWAWTSPNPRRLPEGCREEHPGAGPCTARLLLLRPHPAPRAGGS